MTHRTARVAAVVRQELADLLLREVKDPRVQGALVTDVRVTDDLRYARVYYVVHDPAARAGAQAGLERAAPFLRRALGARMRMRYTPDLKFEHDDSFDRAARISELLKEEQKK